MIQGQQYGYIDFAVHGPVRSEDDWMKGRDQHDVAELDMSSASKSGAKMALVIDFTTKSIALRYEMPSDEQTKTVAPMHEAPVDWRAANPPVGADPHAEWVKVWEEAEAKRKAAEAPLSTEKAEEPAKA